MPTRKSSDYKLSAVKYYLSHSKNLIKGAYDRNEKYIIITKIEQKS
tara:strand:- start:262 stop:399 length:138 start_codon:yes stop_codon:yes gene_type:complete